MGPGNTVNQEVPHWKKMYLRCLYSMHGRRTHVSSFYGNRYTSLTDEDIMRMLNPRVWNVMSGPLYVVAHILAVCEHPHYSLLFTQLNRPSN